jgi:hypothetical protein
VKPHDYDEHYIYFYLDHNDHTASDGKAQDDGRGESSHRGASRAAHSTLYPSILSSLIESRANRCPHVADFKRMRLFYSHQTHPHHDYHSNCKHRQPISPPGRSRHDHHPGDNRHSGTDWHLRNCRGCVWTRLLLAICKQPTCSYRIHVFSTIRHARRGY